MDGSNEACPKNRAIERHCQGNEDSLGRARYLITLVRGANKLEVMQELWVPQCGCVRRQVSTPDVQENSVRNFVATLSEEERHQLKNDPRVLDITLEEGVNRLRPKPMVVQSINPVMSELTNSSHDNWALDTCSDRNGNAYTYSHEGTGVDIVFVDSGIDPAHSEFQRDGSSRVQQIEWMANQFIDRPAQYVDTEGHGTGVSSCGVGKYLGFAKDAKIYSIKIFDEDAYSPLTALQLVRQWHNAKTNGRPTIVNNSWGYSEKYPTGHPLAGQSHPIQVTAIDAEIESMIDAGMIVVSAAGNEWHHVAAEGTAEYNEFYYVDAQGNYTTVQSEASYFEYMNRYSPGASGETICVGSIGEFGPLNKFRMSWFSNFGSRVDVFAPGRSIQCARSGTSSGRRKYDGTSFSSGIISGIVALWLQINPNASQTDVLNWLQKHGDINEVVGSLEAAKNIVSRSLYNGVRIGKKDMASAFVKENGVWKNMQHIYTKSGLAYGNRRV